MSGESVRRQRGVAPDSDRSWRNLAVIAPTLTLITLAISNCTGSGEDDQDGALAALNLLAVAGPGFTSGYSRESFDPVVFGHHEVREVIRGGVWRKEIGPPTCRPLGHRAVEVPVSYSV